MVRVGRPTKSKDVYKKKSKTTKYITKKRHRPKTQESTNDILQSQTEVQCNKNRPIASTHNKVRPPNIYDQTNELL